MSQSRLDKYLELAKIDELVEQLKAEGYDVTRSGEEQSANGGNLMFDLVARRDNEIIAFEVKSQPALKEAAQQIRQLRLLAEESGYTDFRLVVPRPPHEVDIDFAGLELAFYQYMNEDVPRELFDLSSGTSVDEVTGLEYDAVRVTPGEIRIKGSGIVTAKLEYDGGDEKEGLTLYMDFPFTFDVILDKDSNIQNADIDVDVESFYE